MSVLVLIGCLVLWGVAIDVFVIHDSEPKHHGLPVSCKNDFDGGY